MCCMSGAGDVDHTGSRALLLPSARSGRVFGTSDRTHGYYARSTGVKQRVDSHVSASKADL
ncbi:MAG: hypothetical protein JWL61_737 [Gemmatimonadetes bacterium]|nr:hypothetical protein [Gemmatimonadota bacterium]